MQQIAADLLVPENLEQDQIPEADYDRQPEHDADEPDAAEDAPDAPKDAPDAAELRARLKEAKLEEHVTELGALGVALARSVSSMGDINSRFQDPWGKHFQMKCLDATWMKPMFGTCSQNEKDELSRCMELFFSRRPLLQSTSHPKEDQSQARILKPAGEIEAGWKLMFTRRRLTEPDDRKPILCQDWLVQMWVDWQRKWFPENLTRARNQRSHSQKTSIFNAFVRRTAGDKHFVIAFWATGVPWGPPLEMLQSDLTGALEHVATHFAQWTRQLARSVAYHKSLPATEEATRRSGHSHGRHGLSPQ
jgi:hypothetical protein